VLAPVDTAFLCCGLQRHCAFLDLKGFDSPLLFALMAREAGACLNLSARAPERTIERDTG
jgi:hypothetical protein